MTTTEHDLDDETLLAEVLKSLQSPVRYSWVCHAHDQLLDVIAKEQHMTLIPSTAINSFSLSSSPSPPQSSLSSSTTTTVKDSNQNQTNIKLIYRLCDYLRLLQLSSQLLLGIIRKHNHHHRQQHGVGNEYDYESNNDNPRHQHKEKVLQETISKSKILLNLLESTYSIPTITTTTTKKSLLPLPAPLLQSDDSTTVKIAPHSKMEGLYTYSIVRQKNGSSSSSSDDDDSDDDDNDQNLLRFDRNELAQEEQDLIHMANTPIPSELAVRTKQDEKEDENSSDGGEQERSESSTTDHNNQQQQVLSSSVQTKLEQVWSREEIETCREKKMQKRQKTEHSHNQ